MMLAEGDEKISRLYKYRPDNEHTLDVLRDQQLYFSFPNARDLNDPFDCRIIFTLPRDHNGWKTLADKIDLPEDARQCCLGFLRSEQNRIEVTKWFEENYQFRGLMVYCLSEIRDNILMWSHYANAHRGICIGFETTIHQNSLCIRTNDPQLANHTDDSLRSFVPVSEVKYRREYPEPCDALRDQAADLVRFMETKGTDWKYEQERRVILPYAEINKRVIHYDKSALKEVILGFRITKGFKEEVIRIVKTEYEVKGHHVNIFQSERDDKEYKLNTRPLRI